MKKAEKIFNQAENFIYKIAMKTILLTISQVASAKISNTPSREIPQNIHRWKCAHCNQISETENNLPPSNYNCPSTEEIHAWESFDVNVHNDLWPE